MISDSQILICLSIAMLFVGGGAVLLRGAMVGLMQGVFFFIKGMIVLALVLSQGGSIFNSTLLLVALIITLFLPLMVCIFSAIYLRLIRFNGSANIEVETTLRQ